MEEKENIFDILDKSNENMTDKIEESSKKLQKNKVGQEQIQDLIFSREIGWQEIIYDLIHSEQLDPWDINLILLTNRYLEKIRELENADFNVSSKVLLAAALLVRIKSEFLLNKYIKSIDEILFGKKEDKRHVLERIELDEEIPELVPRSPLPRARKVTLKELIESLTKAITTENRRIKKEVLNKNALRESSISMPKIKFNISDKIKEIYERILEVLKIEKTNKHENRIPFTEFTKNNREEKIIAFFPLLQLENQKKIWLEQENHFEEIYIWIKEIYLKHNPDPFEELRKELEAELEEFAENEGENINDITQLENPLGEEKD